jgi:hypothetical protein
VRQTALAALVTLVLAALPPAVPAAPGQTVGEIEVEADRGLLRVRNTTPFIMLLYVAKVRVGWVKPFRTEVLRGLRDGYHRLYAHSEYGSASWGPRSVWVPGTLNVTFDARRSRDLDTAMASRIFRSNRASLIACDKIAERRGESTSGVRAEFEVQVDARGNGTVTVSADSGAAQLLSCYRAVVTQWKYPQTGAAYTVSFQHVH